MSIAVMTRYHGPTNHNGARISAHDPENFNADRIVRPYPYDAPEGSRAHERIARAWLVDVAKLEGDEPLVCAPVKNGWIWIVATEVRS